jgi:hypothetical protein
MAEALPATLEAAQAEVRRLRAQVARLEPERRLSQVSGLSDCAARGGVELARVAPGGLAIQAEGSRESTVGGKKPRVVDKSEAEQQSDPSCPLSSTEMMMSQAGLLEQATGRLNCRFGCGTECSKGKRESHERECVESKAAVRHIFCTRLLPRALWLKCSSYKRRSFKQRRCWPVQSG